MVRIKGHSELYARLAMTIVCSIVTGEFDNEQYLPSIPKLMEEYGITKNTARRALSLLNSLGIAQTIDKKGSVITAEGDTSIAFIPDGLGCFLENRLLTAPEDRISPLSFQLLITALKAQRSDVLPNAFSNAFTLV